jgi:hypothetical protein
VPLESVVHALHRIHAALVSGGLVLDMQPIAPRPPVEANGIRLGSLDMREWRRQTIDPVAELVDDAIAEGLFEQEGERRYEVLETFDEGKELVETVQDWTGTKISRSLAARVQRATPPLVIREGIRLRLLRAP